MAQRRERSPSTQCVPGSIPGLGVKSGLSLFLLLLEGSVIFLTFTDLWHHELQIERLCPTPSAALHHETCINKTKTKMYWSTDRGGCDCCTGSFGQGGNKRTPQNTAKTFALYVRFTVWYISFPSSAKRSEMTKFKVLCGGWAHDKNSLVFPYVYSNAVDNHLVPGWLAHIFQVEQPSSLKAYRRYHRGFKHFKHVQTELLENADQPRQPVVVGD